MKASCGTSTWPTIFIRRLPSLLPLEQFALSGDVTAVAFGGHILALRLDGLARNDPTARPQA